MIEKSAESGWLPLPTQLPSFPDIFHFQLNPFQFPTYISHIPTPFTPHPLSLPTQLPFPNLNSFHFPTSISQFPNPFTFKPLPHTLNSLSQIPTPSTPFIPFQPLYPNSQHLLLPTKFHFPNPNSFNPFHFLTPFSSQHLHFQTSSTSNTIPFPSLNYFNLFHFPTSNKTPLPNSCNPFHFPTSIPNFQLSLLSNLSYFQHNSLSQIPTPSISRPLHLYNIQSLLSF